MKILIITSALDLRLPYGCTSAWWYLLKALYENDVDLLVTVYQGRTIPSLWWASYENPCYLEGYFFAKLKNYKNRLMASRRECSDSQQRKNNGLASLFTLEMAKRFVRPKWESHLARILKSNQDTDAVLFMNVPINQLSGIPRMIHEKFSLPVIYYDPDLPVSLPSHDGFNSGFRIYEGADLTEYDLFIGNSIEGGKELLKIGAKKYEFLPWAVDPDVIKPFPVTKQDIDVFFYGYGDEYRQDWMESMLVTPSKVWPSRKICARGQGFSIDLKNVQLIENLPFNRLRETCSRSKINLNIGRKSHTTFYGSSSMRPYELAAMETCMVSNPYMGLEEWFEPGKEMYLLSEPEEISELYPWLWERESERIKIGKKARERVLKEHTYNHRAQRLKKIISEIS